MSRIPAKAINLLLICAGFAGALFLYNLIFAGGLSPYEMLMVWGTSVLAFWLALELKNGGVTGTGHASWWVTFIEQFCLGTGANLLLHAVLTYAFYIRRTPFVISAGGLLAAASLTLHARWRAERRLSQKRLLLVGFDALAGQIMPAIRPALIGVVANDPADAPAGVPWLGGVDSLEEALNKYKPSNVIVSMKDWASRIPPQVLLNCRLSGVEVEESPAIYEKLFNRVCCERLQPVDLLLSSTLRGDSRTMAIQSVYTNLIGLPLLLLLAPLIFLIALSIMISSGPGPVFESLECAGFQYIPFRLLRFRTTRQDGTATMTGAGRWISRMRMTNLPQLLNVVRGDMALVGPKPVRSEFARYLTDVMPFYSHRFSVKPGIIGWAQTHTPVGDLLPDECRQIEYDLFYIKEGSLWLDVEIMMQSMGPDRSPKAHVAGIAVQQGAGL